MILLKPMDTDVSKNEKIVLKTTLPPKTPLFEVIATRKPFPSKKLLLKMNSLSETPFFKIASVVKTLPSENFSNVPLTQIEIPLEEGSPVHDRTCLVVVATFVFLVHMTLIIWIIQSLFRYK